MRSDEFGEVIGPFLRTDLDFAFQALLDQRPEFVTSEKSSAILSSSKAIVQEDGPRRRENEGTRTNEKEVEKIVEAETMEVATEWQMVNPEKEEDLQDDEEDPELWAGIALYFPTGES